ncbi:hypothetical protein [Flavobacterium silvaticum]|uniref:Uncharacterized protein n=1 Tax=Flavobacterium silvaticum TaxID=1852020 RepID=A0A972FLY7_9FLAO|nr:hypothetical protein [Flavobacterium silvaticum]NMH28441.1 hypothetical protein [Flavobacterium silvaticum]
MNLTEEQTFQLAKKALEDIGQWENFVNQKSTFVSKEIDENYNSDYWLVHFVFSDADDVSPIVTIIDDTKLVHSISWKTSNFDLTYDAANDKYFHLGLNM